MQDVISITNQNCYSVNLFQREIFIQRRSEMDPETSYEPHQRSGIKRIPLPEDELPALEDEAGHEAGNVNHEWNGGDRSGGQT